MSRLRLMLAPVLVLGALAVRSQMSSTHDDAASSPGEPAVTRPLDTLRADRDRPIVTTTTTTTPPSTTTAPPPPPPPAAHAAQAARPSPAPAPAPAPAPPAAPVAAPDSEGRALQLLNDERARAGLAPLRRSGGASSVARSWSSYMATHRVAHNPNLARDLNRAGVSGWRTIGENVGRGSSVEQIHAMFMQSGSHRSNILSSAFSEVGIGVVSSGGRLWLTMDFVGW